MASRNQIIPVSAKSTNGLREITALSFISGQVTGSVLSSFECNI